MRERCKTGSTAKRENKVSPRNINHFRNLSRGLLCKCPTPRYHIMRLQSSHCEQKHWDRILHDVGAELLYTLANGHVAIVHDVSERNRDTRACWQGLSWIRYACHRAWNPDSVLPPSEVSKHGYPLNAYWELEWSQISRSTRHWLEYFDQYYTPGNKIYLRSCWVYRKGREEALARDMAAGTYIGSGEIVC